MSALAHDLPGPMSSVGESSVSKHRAGELASHEDHERAEQREAVHRLGVQDFGEDFEVYRSGAATTLLCLRCAAARTILGRIRLTALVDEAAAHADTCPGREE